LGDINEEEMVLAAQLAQDAQAGYACDYCNKCQPMAFSEVKECMKGVRALGSQLKSESLAYQGKRYALRLCSDWYGKGIVRGQAETQTSAPTQSQMMSSMLRRSAPARRKAISVDST
jgi:hypothetical protein